MTQIPSKTKKENFILIVVLVIVGFSIYAFNLNNSLFWDDIDWIVNNSFAHSFSWENIKNWFTQNILAGVGLSSNYYRPFLLFTFALNYVFGGDSPFGYHLLSNMLHISNAVLIFLLLFAVFKSKFISFWASLIWLVHPLQTEAVTYVSGRGDPLNVFFMLLILYLWTPLEVASPKSSGLATLSRVRPLTGWITLVLLVLALLSRETAVIFPLLFVVFYVAFLYHRNTEGSGNTEKNRNINHRNTEGSGNTEVKRKMSHFVSALKSAFKEALPYFGVVFVYGILRLTVLNFENTLNFYSRSNPYADSFLVRMYTFLNVLWTYAGVMILPLWQHMERSVTIYTYFWNIPVVSSFMVLVFVLWVLRCQYKKFQIPSSKFQGNSNYQNFKKDWKLKIVNS